jgi:hypothetical protein
LLCCKYEHEKIIHSISLKKSLNLDHVKMSKTPLTFFNISNCAMKDVDFFFKKETVASALKWYIRYISVWKLQFLNNVICQNEGQSPKA